MKMKKILGAVATLSMICLTATTAFAATPVYQYGFDGDLGGATVVTRSDATPEMPAANSSVSPVYVEGVHGQAISLDGTYGLQLPISEIGKDYTISFWVNPARFSDFSPFLVLGSNFLDDTKANWLSITKSSWVGDTSPTVWSRNASLNVWPWCDATDAEMIAKNEWTHIAVTVNSADDTSAEEANTVGCKIYVNGELKKEGGHVAADVLLGDVLAFVGINPWDTVQKEIVDDIKIYNTALTAEEVKDAMDTPAGDAAVASTDTAATTDTTASTDVPKTGVASSAVIFGLGAAVLGTGAVASKRKEK